MYEDLPALYGCKTVKKIAERALLLDNLPTYFYNGDFSLFII